MAALRFEHSNYIKPALQNFKQTKILAGDRTVQMDLNDTAIVSFPSFHVALALLSAVALGLIRRLRVLAWILTVLVCISTIAAGWHYGIDVLGGIGVATVSIFTAGRISDKSGSASAS